MGNGSLEAEPPRHGAAYQGVKGNAMRSSPLRILLQTTTPASRGAAHSSFHHFADYNWDTRKGAPSFVTEPEGTGMSSNARAAADIRAYVANLARWLAPD